MEVGYDDKYMLVKQLGLKRDNRNNSYQVPDETKIYYWIIEIDKQIVYGPLSEKDFVDKKEELNISKELLLKDVSSYKKNISI